MKNRVALIGFGNTLFKDEGVALYIVKYIRENYNFEQELSIIDGGGLGFSFISLLQEYERVIVVNIDTENAEDFAKITLRSHNEFLKTAQIKKTANEVELFKMLQICSLTARIAKTTVISISPKDISSVEIGLSESLQKSWNKYIDVVLQELEKQGCKSTKKSNKTSLKEILHSFM